MKIYREALSTKLPNKDGYYFVINEGREETMFYYKVSNKWTIETFYGEEVYTPECWLESIEVELDSEQILHIDNRIVYQNNWQDIFLENNSCEQLDSLEKYHKALEAAELQVVKFKKQNTELMLRNFELESDNGFINKQLQGATIRTNCIPNYLHQIETLEQDADSRYQKAWEYINNFHGCDVSESKYCEVDSLEETLKLAAYGKIE